MWMPHLHPLLNLAFTGIFIAVAYILAARLVALAIEERKLLTTSRAMTQMRIRRRNFEKNEHLLAVPPDKTPVVLIAPNNYLRDYHGAAPGQRGAVVTVGRPNPDAQHVMVNWTGEPGNLVLMRLGELRLALDN